MTLQELEDNKVETHIEYEANRLFREWEIAPEITLGGKSFKQYIAVIDIRPIAIYMNYDDTAKYRNSDVRKLIMEKFNQLINMK